MRFERLTLAGDPIAAGAGAPRARPGARIGGAEVAEIIARVRASGDDALRYYTRRFDTGGSTRRRCGSPRPS